jgi:hypothetical protein
MTVSTTSAAFYITPGKSHTCDYGMIYSRLSAVVFKTFFHHFQAKGRKLKDGDNTAVATDDVFFDE